VYYVGIDLGGTNIVAGVLDEDYRMIGRAAIKTAMPRPAKEIIADMARAIVQATENAGVFLDNVDSIGIGTPGSVDRETGTVMYAGNLNFSNVRIVDEMRAILHKERIFLENDANAAAAGEYYAGHGRGKRSFMQITLGTGIGGGVISDGRMLIGFNGAGGELGHTVIVENGEQCTCGRKGCFEAYASATALIRQTKAAMMSDPASKMWEIAGGLDRVDGRTPFDAAGSGDPTAREVVKQYLRYVACGITNMINIFQPEVLCIGGGICNQGDNLLLPIKQMVSLENFARNCNRQTDIKISSLGNDAGIIGAALLCKLA